MQIVKQFLERRGLTQEEFGDEIGVSQGMVSLYLSGEKRPSLDTLLSMSQYMKVPIEKLIADLPKQVA